MTIESKNCLGALALLVICSGACSWGGPAGSERTASANSPRIAPLACTPLPATQAPTLSCTASSAADVALASDVQARIAAQMLAAFSRLTVTPNEEANQVVLTSAATEFEGLFGPRIVAPLTPGGMFTVAVPFPVGALAPGFRLVANVFGAVPGLVSPFATAAPSLSTGPLASAGGTSASFAAAFNEATLRAAASSAVKTPLTLLVSTPAVEAPEVSCSGEVPLGCL